jgi:hypothetical protein
MKWSVSIGGGGGDDDDDDDALMFRFYIHNIIFLVMLTRI